MAKRKSSTAMVLRPAQLGNQGPRTITIQTPRPIVHQGGHTKKGHKGGHRRSASAGGSNDMTSTLLIPGAAGLILGWIDKNQTQVPTIPMLGRAGTLALGAWFFRKHSMKYLPKLAGGFAAIALYEWQREGSIAGNEGVAASF